MSLGQATSPMNRLMFDGMALSFRIRDLLKPPPKVLQNVGLEPGMTVVDYGCGPGSYTLAAADMVGPQGKVYGVDIHPQAAATVRRKAARRGFTHVEAVQVDGYATGIPADSVDCVMLMDMIHMVPDRAALLAEVRRILKRDGYAYVQVHHTSPDAIRADVEDSGLFTVTRVDGQDLFASPTAG